MGMIKETYTHMNTKNNGNNSAGNSNRKGGGFHNTFGDALKGLPPEKERKVKAAITAAACIRLNSSYCASKTFSDFVPISESLVAFDTQTNKIVRFVDCFIPSKERGQPGTRFKIASNGAPMHGFATEPNHFFQLAYFDFFKLPNSKTVEFKMLRVFAEGYRVPYQLQVIDLKIPLSGEFKRSPESMRDIIRTNKCDDLFSMKKVREQNGEFTSTWHNTILAELSAFSGLELYNSYGGVRESVAHLVAAGAVSETTRNELEAIAANKEDEESFYVPDNPALKSASSHEDTGFVPSIVETAQAETVVEMEEEEAPVNPAAVLANGNEDDIPDLQE